MKALALLTHLNVLSLQKSHSQCWCYSQGPASKRSGRPTIVVMVAAVVVYHLSLISRAFSLPSLRTQGEEPWQGLPGRVKAACLPCEQRRIDRATKPCCCVRDGRRLEPLGRRRGRMRTDNPLSHYHSGVCCWWLQAIPFPLLDHVLPHSPPRI